MAHLEYGSSYYMIFLLVAQNEKSLQIAEYLLAESGGMCAKREIL